MGELELGIHPDRMDDAVPRGINFALQLEDSSRFLKTK
jgi:hypothetical protein